MHSIGDQVRVNVLSGIERHLNNDAMHRGVIIEFSDMLQQLRLTGVAGQLHTPGTDTYLLSCLDLHLDVHIAVLSSTNLAEDDTIISIITSIIIIIINMYLDNDKTRSKVRILSSDALHLVLQVGLDLG